MSTFEPSEETMRETFDAIGRVCGTDKASRCDAGRFEGSGGHGYLEFYQEVLGRRRDEPLRILEIGVLYGYSLLTWERCFPKASIVGIDVHRFTEASTFERAQIEIFDAARQPQAESFLARHPDGFDLVVEDASHQSAEMIRLLELYWPAVRPGGWYAMEDVRCGYELYYGGEPHGDSPSIVDRVRHLVDDALATIDGIRQLRVYRNIVFLEKAS